MIAWITAKLQDDAKQGVHSAYRGVAHAQNANKCKQGRQDAGHDGGHPRGGEIPSAAGRTNLVGLVDPR